RCQVLDQCRRGGSASGDPDGVGVAQPLRLEVGGVLQQPGGNALAAGHPDQAFGVVRVRRAEDQHDVALGADGLNGVLPVGGGVADVVGGSGAQQREPCPQ